jgi:hypothetical protein
VAERMTHLTAVAAGRRTSATTMEA